MPPKRSQTSRPRSKRLGVVLESAIQDDSLEDAFNELRALESASVGHRTHAPKTQQDENRVLETYKTFVKAYRKLGDVNDDALEAACFPDPVNKSWEPMCTLMRQFLIFAAKNTPPRNNEYRYIAYNTLRSQMDKLLFWVKMKYQFRPTTPEIPYAQIKGRLLEAVQYMASQLDLLSGRTKKKTILTYAEVIYLIDQDTATTACYELSEAHHWAWLVGRCCALRPGSLGGQRLGRGTHTTTSNGPDFVVWDDVNLTRGAEKGEFSLTLKIRNLKDSNLQRNLDHNSVTGAKGSDQRFMDFHFKSPTLHANLPYSPALRLLAIALRREALADIHTIEDLLEGQVNAIRIKDEFKQEPIILAGTYRGLGVSKDAATSGTLTEYLKTRALQHGFTERITFYSLRRSAAESITQAYGLDIARQIMGHDPDSITLERSYLNLRRHVDLTAVGLDEDHEQRKSEISMDQNSNVLFRMSPGFLKDIVEPAADALYHKLVDQDEVLKTLVDASEQKYRKRCLRRIAMDTARRQVIEEGSHKITTNDLNKRKEEISNRMARFTQLLVEKARASAREQGHSTLAELAPEDGSNPDVDLAVPADSIAEADCDADTSLAQSRSRIMSEELNDAEVAPEIAFVDAVRYVLEELLDNNMSKSLSQGLFCELCISDTTATEQQKQRQWPDEAHLKRHQEAKFHVGYEAWLRRVKSIKKTHKSTGYECELYASSAPPKAPVHLFATVDELEHHISGSDSGGITGIRAAWVTEPAIIEQHNALKQALGWDRPEFRSSAAGELRNQADRSKKRKNRGWQSENLRELDNGLDVPGNPAIILGGPRRPSFPAIDDRKGSVLLYPAQEILPESSADLLSIAFTVPDERVGVPDAESTVHTHLVNHRSSMVTILPPPGTNDNTPSHHLDIISLVNSLADTSKP